MVERLIPQLAERGIPMLSNDDGCIVPFDHAEETRDLLREIARQHLGFAPHIAIKGNDNPSIATWELGLSKQYSETRVAT